MLIEINSYKSETECNENLIKFIKFFVLHYTYKSIAWDVINFDNSDDMYCFQTYINIELINNDIDYFQLIKEIDELNIEWDLIEH